MGANSASSSNSGLSTVQTMLTYTASRSLEENTSPANLHYILMVKMNFTLLLKNTLNGFRNKTVHLFVCLFVYFSEQSEVLRIRPWSMGLKDLQRTDVKKIQYVSKWQFFN